jgi:hypothetical protein
MILLATMVGVLIGSLAGSFMHSDFRASLGVERHSVVAAGILIGGLTGLMGGVTMVVG